VTRAAPADAAYHAAVSAWQRARLPSPRLQLTDAKRRTFDVLLASARPHRPFDYRCVHPKHEFLNYLVRERGYLLHGSRQPDIERFEPRQAADLYAFSAQRAVYAASDGIWPMVFAIRDRRPGQGTFFNGCSRLVHADGTWSEPYYHFALAADGLRQQPWTHGTIYVLPREHFVPHPLLHEHGLTFTLEEWASPEPSVPVLKLDIEPADFPFLNAFWGYDPQLLQGPHVWTELDHTDPALFPIQPHRRRPRRRRRAHDNALALRATTLHAAG
jgi:hypothetical protein